MSTQQLCLLYSIILLELVSLDAVKIGISKPLSTTTTVTPNTTSLETTVFEEDEQQTELPTTTTSTTTITTPSTTSEETTSEAEWPEFPPKKYPINKTTTTTTRKPLRITKKPKTTTTSSPSITEATENANKTDITPTVTVDEPTDTRSLDKYCFCDLTTKQCDINCCCDPDCPSDILKVFKCLKEDTADFEIHEGRFENFKFQHGLPSCEVNDGWLCVFRTNIPTTVEKPHSNFFDTSAYFKWPNLLKEDLDTESREFYMYGDALKLINMETNIIRNFDLPLSINSHLCQGKEPITHLKSQKRSCLKTKIKTPLEEVQPNIWEIHDKYKILRKPTIPEEVHTPKQLEQYVANVTLRWCNETLNKCLKLNLKHTEYVDIQELSKIQIHIFHNFTNIWGIFINLWPESKETSTTQDTWLIYEVIFVNETITEMQEKEERHFLKDYGKITSGPLGYTIGKPLILAKYVAVNKSLPLSDKNQELNYFSDNQHEKNIWGLFKKHQGLCKPSEPGELEDTDYLSYGINLAKQCKIRMNNETLFAEDPSKTNFTIVCLSLQDLIHRQLLGHDFNLADISSYFVSQLGKPQNSSDTWLSLNVFNADFNPVFGQYMENSATIICRNILLSLSYEFHIGTYYVDDVADQHLIKHATLSMGERHDLEFSLDERIEVPLALTVRFYDVNEKATSCSSQSWFSPMIYLILVLYV